MMPSSGDVARSGAEGSEALMPDARSEADLPGSVGGREPLPVMPVWAGIVVRDLEQSSRWYTDALGLAVAERGAEFALLRFPDGSILELVSGQPDRPGSAFPSYGDDPGPPVVPGFRVPDPADTGRDMVVARWLPEWVVVVGPGGLRSVLCCGQGEARTGLVGFDVAGPDPEGLTAWFGGFGARVAVAAAPCLRVAPVVAGLADAELVDPDGTVLRLTT